MHPIEKINPIAGLCEGSSASLLVFQYERHGVRNHPDGFAFPNALTTFKKSHPSLAAILSSAIELCNNTFSSSQYDRCGREHRIAFVLIGYVMDFQRAYPFLAFNGSIDMRTS